MIQCDYLPNPTPNIDFLIPDVRPIARLIERGVQREKYAVQWTYYDIQPIAFQLEYVRYLHHTTLVGGQ